MHECVKMTNMVIAAYQLVIATYPAGSIIANITNGQLLLVTQPYHHLLTELYRDGQAGLPSI